MTRRDATLPGGRPPSRPRGGGWRCALAALALLAAGWPRPGAAKGGVYRQSPHGRPDTGVQRVPGLARGECGHCHGSREAAPGRRDGQGHAGLFDLNENTLCLGCHRVPVGSYLGERRYQESAHGTSPLAVWPGPTPPARDSRDAGKCVNCHDPHGVKDAAGLVPGLARIRGAALCLRCHAGNPGRDVASAFDKSYTHPLVTDAGDPSAAPARPGGAGLAGGGATCSGCHNPHAAGLDPARRAAASRAGALAGLSRAVVTNGAPGRPPAVTLVPARDETPAREYEVCFKCHAGSSARVTRGAVGAAFNPANASYHPVEAAGRNRRIDRRSFVQGWGPDQLMTCSDCHASDDEVVRGPHGSSHPHILKRRYEVGGSEESMLETDLCFDCHAFRTYGDAAGRSAGEYSRYPGHAAHLSRGTTCWSCHESHGSATQPALIALRSPGIVTYAQEPTGGTCTVTCHRTSPPRASYRATYSR